MVTLRTPERDGQCLPGGRWYVCDGRLTSKLRWWQPERRDSRHASGRHCRWVSRCPSATSCACPTDGCALRPSRARTEKEKEKESGREKEREREIKRRKEIAGGERKKERKNGEGEGEGEGARERGNPERGNKRLQSILCFIEQAWGKRIMIASPAVGAHGSTAGLTAPCRKGAGMQLRLAKPGGGGSR